MKLNHLDLQVPDVRRSVEFFERYFDFELRSNRASPAIAIMTGRDGFSLVLQRCKNEGETYPEGFHFGFLVESEQAVRAHHARMVADGIESISAVDSNNRGVMFYCRSPGGITVEVGYRPG